MGRAKSQPPSSESDPAGIPASGTAIQQSANALPAYARDLAELEIKFKRAMQSMMMHFQPIVEAQSRVVFGYEALLRSKDPDLPHPGALLDAAERLNRLDKLGKKVRAKTAEVFAHAETHRGYLFVNLHALDLLDKSLSSPFAPLAKIANRVVLEITEQASLEGVPDVDYRVSELRKMGFRIAIDDLGAGHARTNRFPLKEYDFVKLDMSVVRDIDTDARKQEFVREIIKLCCDEDIMLVGEGVETEGECKFLVEVGCHLLQGYLIARPGPPFVSVSK